MNLLLWRQARNSHPSANDFHCTALAVKELLNRYTLRKLFPQIEWESLPTEQAEGEAYMVVPYGSSNFETLRGLYGAWNKASKSFLRSER